MTGQKPVFIIPGFKHRPANKAYKKIASLFKKEGYSPILIRIPWRGATISESTDYFLREYKKVHKKTNTCSVFHSVP